MAGVVEASVHVQNSISIFGIFAEGSLVVKLVMLILSAFSLVSWAIIFKKSWIFNKLHREIKDIEVVLNSQNATSNVREIAECGVGIVSQILQYGIKNARLVTNKREGFNKFAGAELSRSANKLGEQLDILSIVGSSSIFIGLLGAVWSMIENLKILSISGWNMDMAILSPSIAEILYTLAFGLLVSIPANIFYRRFIAAAERITNRLGSVVYELGVFVANDE